MQKNQVMLLSENSLKGEKRSPLKRYKSHCWLYSITDCKHLFIVHHWKKKSCWHEPEWTNTMLLFWVWKNNSHYLINYSNVSWKRDGGNVIGIWKTGNQNVIQSVKREKKKTCAAFFLMCRNVSSPQGHLERGPEVVTKVLKCSVLLDGAKRSVPTS